MIPAQTEPISRGTRHQIPLAVETDLVGRYVDAVFAPPVEKSVSMFDAAHNRLWRKVVTTRPQLTEVLLSAAANARGGSRVSVARNSTYDSKSYGMPVGHGGANDITLTFREQGFWDLEVCRTGSLDQIESIERSVEPFDTKQYTPSQPNYAIAASQPDPFQELSKQMQARRVRRRDDWIKTSVILLTIAIIVLYSIYITR
jgi:hypothetical protein